MTSDSGLSSKLAEALGGHDVEMRLGKTLEMVERCANAAEMGVRIAYLSHVDPRRAAEQVATREGSKLIEHLSPKGKLRACSVRFESGGEVLFTHSRMRAKSFGAAEIVT
jgi:hypothetical protein